jgi:hypothetical protein
MSGARGWFLGLACIVGAGCTLKAPDRPDSGNAAGTGASTGSSNGSGGALSGSSAGNGSATAGSSKAGSTTGDPDPAGEGGGDSTAAGGADGGGTNGGGSNSAGGTASNGCVPQCDNGKVCTSGACACPSELSACPDGCVDLQNDPAHCGACRYTCADKCSHAHCYRELAELSKQTSAYYLAVDSKYVYFTQTAAGTVSRVPIAGGAVATIASAQFEPRTITVDYAHVYWVNNPSTYGTGSVMKASLNGGAATAIATTEPAPVFVAVDADRAYWINYPPQPPLFMSAPLAGGTKTQFPMGDETSNAIQISLDSQNMYWAGWSDNGGVWSTPLDGQGPTKRLATLDKEATNAVVYDGIVYYLSGGAIKKVPTTGGMTTDVAVIPGGNLFVDASGIYLGSATPPGGVKNSIVRLSFDGATVTTLAVGASGAYAFAVGSNEVFWIDSDLKIKAAYKDQ